MTYETPKAVTFDCYGTLIRFFEGLETVARAIVDRHGGTLTSEQLIAAYSDAEHRLEQEPPHRPFKEVSPAAMREAFGTLGLTLGPGEEMSLVEAIPTFGPFEEVPAVLERLGRSCRLCIISNTDDDLIAGNVARLGVPIDEVVTAEQAGAYKPSEEIFRYAHRRLGLEVDDIVHVAQGQRLDIAACKALGLRAIWINRYGEPGVPANAPYEELRDLRGVPALLGLEG
ncbi:haloacid dehalogenase type II [Kaustia mangrovi]|uniref:Haloacid dehalogenase type II n=1 Tax=Kaustia mangrovi TaxID=2593653 RepID=A0A7S8HAT7_9HYPH|nr:haloacid dehalogenase type II [Kaustia mangrovi]QPC41806.1 haloacid dehalogenase type II [Kaustia mangrovi]